MDMYQKRKMRQEKKNNNQEETLTNLTLNLKPIMASAKNKRTKKERKST